MFTYFCLVLCCFRLLYFFCVFLADFYAAFHLVLASLHPPIVIYCCTLDLLMFSIDLSQSRFELLMRIFAFQVLEALRNGS